MQTFGLSAGSIGASNVFFGVAAAAAELACTGAVFAAENPIGASEAGAGADACTEGAATAAAAGNWIA